MTRAAIYDKKCSEEDLKISGYYKKDYASLNTWITLIWITVGYVIAAGLFFFYNADRILDGLTLEKFFLLIAVALGVYLVLAAVYAIGAGIFYRNRHAESKERVIKYYRDLSRLERLYKKEKNRS